MKLEPHLARQKLARAATLAALLAGAGCSRHPPNDVSEPASASPPPAAASAEVAKILTRERSADDELEVFAVPPGGSVDMFVPDLFRERPRGYVALGRVPNLAAPRTEAEFARRLAAVRHSASGPDGTRALSRAGSG